MPRSLPLNSPGRRARPLRLTALALCLLQGGCGSSSAEPLAVLRVRARNVGAVPLTALAIVLPRGERIEAATLLPGAATPYTAAREAYRYAYVEAAIDGRRFVRQPIDYVGERPLVGPCVEYELLARTAESHIEIRAREDAACPR